MRGHRGALRRHAAARPRRGHRRGPVARRARRWRLHRARRGPAGARRRRRRRPDRVPDRRYAGRGPRPLADAGF
ncbi:MAG: hypothetical protein EA416_16985 [Trueperaceae bacterium]|nr:MAG: hypothetical protein EA416_16985 [Trueperaceae bacterium]